MAFRKARQHHPGVESAIGALQAGNGLKRCRDRSKRGYERYVALGILGRNLQTLGKLLAGPRPGGLPGRQVQTQAQGRLAGGQGDEQGQGPAASVEEICSESLRPSVRGCQGRKKTASKHKCRGHVIRDQAGGTIEKRAFSDGH